MELLVINPNTTHSMTKKIAAAARQVARKGTKIVATESKKGPASIEGYYDIALCHAGLIEEAARYAEADAVVVACFDDTGLDALRCLFDVPVIGIGEAAYHAASMISTKFSVVTTLSRSVPGLEANLERYGLAKRCAKVRASDVPVLKLEENDPSSIALIKDEIRAAINVDGAEAVVLGCAGMADLMESLSEEFGIPIIDGVASATSMAEALVAAGLKTSKIGAYARPQDKALMLAV
ncbi:aspartate/glutamate racemase family protein [Roseovarius sp. 2305UL8-3]|uniref:aspartate/glutamate racemase family protein n=1 Tax=Roseovarius conchicola TaxID=3121636 RepID=UPI003526FE94